MGLKQLLHFPVSGTILQECNERWSSRNKRHVYTICLTSFTYAVPLLLLMFTYYKVGAKMLVRRTPGNRGHAHKHRDKLFKKTKQKVRIMQQQTSRLSLSILKDLVFQNY